MVPAYERSGLFNGRTPENFEITELRLSARLLQGAGIFRVPSNADLGEKDSRYIYRTDRFPSWSLCVEHSVIYRKTADDGLACPLCNPLPNTAQAWRRANRQAIRFVRACPEGHLDDVDWNGIVQHQRMHNPPRFLRWQGGGSLRNVNIVCPDCGGSVNLGQAYARSWPCFGRFPELGRTGTACGSAANIIQRGAANLRMAELVTALTIPPRSTRLHRLLEMSMVRGILASRPTWTKQDLLTALASVASANLLPATVVAEIDRFPEDQILEAIEHIRTDQLLPGTVELMRRQELQALHHAAAHGYPAHRPRAAGLPPDFEVVRRDVRSIRALGGYTLRITPVSRLRVVMVQMGYRRLDLLNPLVERAYVRPQAAGDRKWFPGVELFGEGIFIDLDPGERIGVPPRQFELTGSAANTWFDAWVDPTNYAQQVVLERDNLHPVFIWWHTLAHRLINALAIDSGYSSAAVRERVLVEVEDTGEAGGGILLYTAQPGGDGTLGGLVALVSDFERVLSVALRDLDACSNDPLCGEETFGAGKISGAACYACALVSETSCEHRNMWLDRNVLLQNFP